MLRSNVAISVILAVCGLLLNGCHGSKCGLGGQRMSTDCDKGFVSKTIKVDGEVYKYAVYVPQEYTPEKSWPAFLFLHGAGERGSDGELQTKVGLGKVIREHPERIPCIVIMPQCPIDRAWEGEMQRMALATLDAAMDEYNIDEDRVVLTGLSLGGFGTWSIGIQNAERFCALVPICGGGIGVNAHLIKDVPVWCFHGDSDPVVKVDRSREMVGAVKSKGGNVRYTEFKGVGHNAWDPAYGDPKVIEWMLAQHR